MRFAIESIQATWGEGEALMQAHHREVGIVPDEDFEPNKEQFFKIERDGNLRLFTIRDQEELVGYSVFIIVPHLHYRNEKWAYQDTLYVAPGYRGLCAYRFMEWVDRQLADMSVKTILRSVTVNKDYSRSLERIGYQKFETGFMRRFN